MGRKKQHNKTHVLVVAAGNGDRFGGAVPKQYQFLAGRPLLRHTLENIKKWPNIDTIRVVTGSDHAESYHNAVQGLNLSESVIGGETRKESVCNGLKSFSNIDPQDIILIHDAARPFVSPQDIENLIEALQDNEAATLALPVSDTLRHEQDGLVERDALWALQTPQAFCYETILKAHENADKTANFTDDTGLVSALGIPVKLVQGSRNNIKITYPEDLIMAEALLKTKMETRTGMGFDVHAFDKASSKKSVRLCGVDILHDYPLAGHSDADVGLHALTDAILGAIGKGDIGQHFPPCNPDFKDMDSAIFLEKAASMIAGDIINADITIICEAPKIGPHCEDMKEKIAAILKIPQSRINIKATTTEGLGFTGRAEGIAAQAIVTLTTETS